MQPPIIPPLPMCSLCLQSRPACRCGTTPAADPPRGFVKMGDSMVCLTCNLDVRYCRGHAAPKREGPPPLSDLMARARASGGIK